MEKDKFVQVVIQQGISKDRRYSFYPYWRLRVGTKEIEKFNDYSCITFTPTRDELFDIIQNVLVHEFVVDGIRRKQRHDITRYLEKLQELENRLQLDLSVFQKPEIYDVDKNLGAQYVLYDTMR